MGVKSVGLFCAASESIDPLYVEHARAVGNLIGEMGLGLVYGGAAAGLMEATAAAAKAAGGHITGVVPQLLIERNRVSALLDERVVTRNLSDRKDNILERSDILLALPGGVGTLDEVFHVMAAATIGYHTKRVLFYNVNGFWDGMIALLHSYKQQGFLRGDCDNYFVVVSTLPELKKLLNC